MTGDTCGTAIRWATLFALWPGLLAWAVCDPGFRGMLAEAFLEDITEACG